MAFDDVFETTRRRDDYFSTFAEVKLLLFDSSLKKESTEHEAERSVE